ncbi:MAG: DNA recombination protein RmuC [Myxococcales bacterium]|nr:DNA recombination protein RmuC [Myxococcales bacterium]
MDAWTVGAGVGALAGCALTLLAAIAWGRALRGRFGVERAALTQALEERRAALDAAQERARAQEDGRVRAERDLAAAAATAGALEERLAGAERAEQRTREAARSAEEGWAAEREKVAALTAEARAQREAAEAREARVRTEVEALGRKMLEQSERRLDALSQAHLGGAVAPLREQLERFQKQVATVHETGIERHASLARHLEQLEQLNQRLGQDARELTEALRGDNRAQGAWGELVLARVLEASGLCEGREYETQVSVDAVRDGKSCRFRLDALVHLPGDRDVVVDAKVSLAAYTEWSSARDDALRASALGRHLDSVRAHVKGLSSKAYESLPGSRKLDFVLMFMPIEPALTLAAQHDPDLFSWALDRRVLLVSPTTLLLALRTIEMSWRQERQADNAAKIAEAGGKLYDKLVGFVASLDQVGKRLVQAQDAFHQARKQLDTGRGNVLRRAEEMRDLGLKTSKRLPAADETLAEDDDGEGEPPGDAPARAEPAAGARPRLADENDASAAGAKG